MPRDRSWRASSGLPLVGSSLTSSGCRRSLRLRLSAADRRLEEIEDTGILIRPRIRPDEAVVLHWVGHQPPATLPELDESLRQADAILEVDVRIDHSMQDEQ